MASYIAFWSSDILDYMIAQFCPFTYQIEFLKAYMT